MSKLWGLQQYWDFLVFKTYADLRSEVDRTYIGYLWWVLEPVLYMLIFYLVFHVLLDRGTQNYVAFLLIGLTTWRWFQTGVMMASNTIISAKGIINQVYVPKVALPMVAVAINSFKFFVIFLILLVFLWVSGYTPGWQYLWLPVLLFLQLSFVIGCSFILAAITPFLPDMKVILDNLLRGMFFISGIFFEIKSVDEPYQSYLMLNPMASLIDQYRQVLVGGLAPDFDLLLLVAVISVVFIVIGLFLLLRFDRVYPRLL
jgi:lipopolysaccharide transport system permease protein